MVKTDLISLEIVPLIGISTDDRGRIEPISCSNALTGKKHSNWKISKTTVTLSIGFNRSDTMNK